MSAIFGSLVVFFTIRLGRRISGSTLVGGLAGFLLTFDGLSFVMSRIALLDVFQTAFAVAALSALAADRDWFRIRLAKYLEKNSKTSLGDEFGPLMLFRPWRLVSGVLFGCSIAVKWNTLYLLAVFGIVAVIWDMGARRLAGAKKPWLSLFTDAPAAFVQMVVVAVPVYVVTWTGWLTTQGGYYRQWGAENADYWTVKTFGAPLASLWYYHQRMYDFHTGPMMTKSHTYEAHPAGWLFAVRPTGIYAHNDIQPGGLCHAAEGSTCLRVISALGTPVLWWMAALALGAAVYFWLVKRDWRFAVPVLATLAIWLPWFQYADRPLFYFYAVMIIPYTCIALAMVMGKVIGPNDGPQRRQRVMGVAIAVALVVLNFAYFYPIYTGGLLTRAEWLARMWLGNLWI